MNIQSEKLDLIEWISRLNDTVIIDKLKEVKDDYCKSKDWWDTLKKEEIDSIRISSARFMKNTYKLVLVK